MGIDVTVTIGGAAGQGIQTVGELLASVCQRGGLFILATNDFESRIRGGHNFMQLRICDEPVAAPDDRNHLLVALNRETFDIHADEMLESGRILMEADGEADADAESPLAGNVVNVGFIRLAKEAGGKIMANTVAAGAVLGMLGAPTGLLDQVLQERFAEKSAELLENNQKAGRMGRDAVKDTAFAWRFDWPERAPRGRLLSGARALALGALAADCRVAAFYPMSPATGIMINMIGFMDRFPLVVEQAEDEIGAINMVVGASFAGVRAMTATSGGGFSLMTEGIGLAGITETPVVAINAQRPGPATGLPTRTAQGDLNFVICAAQDEFPRFVLAPRNLDEAFATVVRAFHLAEKYQVPVIVLVDQYFTDSLAITAEEWKAPKAIERFLTPDAEMADPSAYKRFAITVSGVSPRAVPCAGKARVMVTANEHNEEGHLSETIADRNGQVNKRNLKLVKMAAEMKGPETYYGDSRLLLVGWGSTDGTIREAVERLQGENYAVGAVIFRDIWPFPANQAESALSGCERFLTVELNASSQLGGLIRQHTGMPAQEAIVQYDGRPMRPGWLVEQVKRFLEVA